ncbi:hypothetical protein [Noviherbaspirillum sp. Root189]|uniref:hypothetical protein n=1 Tax=Noviherbaspirillum sp. Root189 TaxID=1736487 RepID=UPI000708B554|nr:hypothetical protein [Noviherbaspirillum sp. Root189]KRB85108.1 hypothetical protein ASE07_21320 [Noviherbaspirillum sp. Root189]
MIDERKSVFDENGPDQEKLHDTYGGPVNLMRQWADERRAAGRFTLEEAALAIVDGVVRPGKAEAVKTHWENDWPLLWSLIQSARTGALPIFSRKGLKIPPDNAPTTEWFERETYWRDLNAWLATNEPNVTFRFPPPPTAALVSQPSKLIADATERATKPASQSTDEASKQVASSINNDNWKAEACKLAQEIGEEKWRSGMREITARNVSESVAMRLASTGDGKYWGKRGPRTGSSVRNEALKGWKFIPPRDVN